MGKFRTLQLSSLIEMHTDFTEHIASVPPEAFNTEEFEDFTKMILMVQSEIELRQEAKIQ